MRLTLHFQIDERIVIDAKDLLPGNLLPMTVDEIQTISINQGNKIRELREICQIQVEHSSADEIVFCGVTDVLQRVGQDMTTGTIIIMGNIGQDAGMRMCGGELIINGSAGDRLGAMMRGGIIQVNGDAGDETGAPLLGNKYGMNGGVIIIKGNVGSYTGRRMRRGLIFIQGDTSKYTGVDLLNGTILVVGQVGYGCGIDMQRGSIVIGDWEPPMQGFIESSITDPLWLHIYGQYLNRLGVPFPKLWMNGKFKRYVGYTTGKGKGEILSYAAV